MSGMYPRQMAGRQQQAPARKRRLVTYYMQPLSEQPGYAGPRQDGHRFGVNRIVRLGEDSLLSAGRDGVVRRWDVSGMLSAKGSGVGRRDAEGTKEAIYVTLIEQNIFWREQTFRLWPRWRDMSTGRCSAAAAATAGGENGDEPSDAQPRCTGIFASHTDWVTGLAVAAGRIMASSSNDGTLKLWDLAGADRAVAGAAGAGDGEERYAGLGARFGGLGAVATEAHPVGVANGAGGRSAAGLGNDGGGGGSATLDKNATPVGVAVKPAPSLRPSPLATVAGHGDYVKCLTYAPEGGVLVSGGLDKRILLWDLQRMAAPLMALSTGEEDGMGVDSPVRGAKHGVRPTASWGGEGPWFHLRDPSRVVLRPGVAAAGPNEVFELCRQNKGSVYCVDASADAALVASGGTDRMIRLLDPRAGSGHAAKVCKLDGHKDNVRCVRIDEGGLRVVSGSTDGTIRVWDVRQQCCLEVYELPGGSVWAMQPSPSDFDVYYSGGRGRRVYRTDFRTGESKLVCMTNSEVLDMALELDRGTSGREQSMSMWLSSTEPDISLWGCKDGGGAALRTGRPTAGTAESSDASQHSLEGEDAGLDEGACLLSGPVETIRGQPGIVRHAVLNNRRHVLTEDDATPPNVALWDVTKAKQIEAFPPGTVMEDKERSLREIIAVRPWFTIGTHLGTPLVSLSESTVFDGELYAVDARGERQTFLASPPPSPPRNSSSDPPPGVSTAATEGNTARAAGVSKGRDGPVRVAKARSVQDEVKVNLGDAVLRGLFSKWIEQHLRLDGDGTSSSRRGAGGGGHGGGRDPENGSAYMSGESDSEDSDQGHGSEYESNSASPGSGLSSQASAGDAGVRQAGSGGIRGSHVLDIDLAGGGRAIGDDTVLWVAETDLGGNGGMQRTLLQKRVGEFDGREGEDVIPHWVTACVLHGDFRVKDQPKLSFFLAPWMPPEQAPPPSTPRQQQQQQQQSASSSSLGKRGGGADAASASRGGGAAGGGKAGLAGGSASGAHPASQRFTAPAQMLVSKVMAYVLSHDELGQHLESTGPEGNEGGVRTEGGEGVAPREYPEDIVEVLCGDRVLEPHLYVGAIKQYIWNSNAGGTLFLHYRSRHRSTGKGQRPTGV